MQVHLESGQPFSLSLAPQMGRKHRARSEPHPPAPLNSDKTGLQGRAPHLQTPSGPSTNEVAPKVVLKYLYFLSPSLRGPPAAGHLCGCPLKLLAPSSTDEVGCLVGHPPTPVLHTPIPERSRQQPQQWVLKTNSGSLRPSLLLRKGSGEQRQ